MSHSLIQIISPCPVLNTPDFSFAFGGNNGYEIPTNGTGRLHCIEFVALKGMCFRVKQSIWQNGSAVYLLADSFPPHEKWYVDSRFTHIAKKEHQTPCFSPKLSTQIILERMLSLIDAPYVWGGNWSQGIPEMLTYYPPSQPIDAQTAIFWTMRGVDCSGLLFEATDGLTPRNTQELLFFGRAVSEKERLQPLDMLIYPGHVVCVLNQNMTIESRFPEGVVVRNLSDRLEELQSQRTFIEKWLPDLNPSKYYTIRRFSTQSLYARKQTLNRFALRNTN